jgi:microcystin-dependent protein
MAYPPTVPVNTRTDGTALVTNHAADHNGIANALTDIINELGTSPKGDFASVQAHLAAVCPLGAVLPYAGASAPTGWGLCDGSAVSRSTYADLFALIGTTYGVGNGSTTFNIPDLRSRFVAGKGTAGWSDALAETGGSKDAVAVSHTHTMTDHSHTVSGTTTGGGAHSHTGNGNGLVYWDTSYGTGQSATTPVGPNSPWALSWQTTIGGGGHEHSWSGTSSGASAGNTTASQSPDVSGTDARLPPYITLNYIIRLT